jgi:hypothetical protein
MNVTRSSSARAPLAFAAQAGSAQDVSPQQRIQDVQEAIGRLRNAVRLARTDQVESITGRIPTLEELRTLDRNLAMRRDIPWRYIADGCYARAHLAADQLRQGGVNVGKIFIYGDLTARNDLMGAAWWYHTACVVWARDVTTGAVEPYVIDPAFSLEPLPIDTWAAKFSEGPVEFDLTGPAQYWPLAENPRTTDFNEHLREAKMTARTYAARLARLEGTWRMPP